ncbi:hypothetical protein QBC46DRAFT_391745 [Diplogelasinospora grovesii]|uniref:Uncharacterized protein n=1 Tax=Diplogelasinospora grovesii TaxID=303347 RepID=A0AAN6S1K1_9PEZI|nr:hypothetical protein QBC46DRAFT_391745 [Diplogelasinospora grovesii]
MAPALPSSNPRAFLTMPLETRRLIYRFFILQKLRFDCSDGPLRMYFQNRPKHWRTPPWPGDKTYDRYLYDTQGGGVSSTPTEEGEDKENEYEPSWLDDVGESLSFTSALPGMLLICRQITDEVEDMLYRGNTFQFSVEATQGRFTKSFSPRTKAKMRKIVLILRPRGVFSWPDFSMDPKFWDAALGHLSILAVIAERPKPPFLHARFPTGGGPRRHVRAMRGSVETSFWVPRPGRPPRRSGSGGCGWRARYHAGLGRVNASAQLPLSTPTGGGRIVPKRQVHRQHREEASAGERSSQTSIEPRCASIGLVGQGKFPTMQYHTPLSPTLSYV